MGEVDLPGILVLELFQAAARTAVAQAFPFGVGHLLQRLGFPEESLLARGRLGGCGPKVGRFPVSFGWALLGGRATKVQVRPITGAQELPVPLGLTIKMVSQTIGL